MPAFAYVAIDERGRARRGIVEADAPRQARASLRNAGMIPVEVSAVDPEAAALGTRRVLWRRHLSSTQLTLLTRRFALLLEAGLTVEQCLDALIEQAEDEAAARVLSTVRAEVVSGHSLAAALDPYATSFPEIYRALVRTGEQSGELTNVMLRLADYLEARQAIKQSAGLALIYPAIVAGVALAIVAGLLTYVVPQVVHVFQNSHQTLPLLTRMLVALSDLLRGKLLFVLLALALCALLVRVSWTRRSVRRRWQMRLLSFPLLGSLLQGLDTARFASTLAILIGSGVPLLQALSAGTRVLNLIPLRDTVDEAIRLVREGSSLHRALAKSRMFPPMFIHLISSGEASGRLAHMLSQAAKQQEFESETRVRLVTSVLEPVVIIVMGVVVLLIVLAVLLPIIQMNELIHI